MRPRLHELLSGPHEAESQGPAAHLRTDEDALREAELAQVVGGTGGPPTPIGGNNGRS